MGKQNKTTHGATNQRHALTSSVWCFAFKVLWTLAKSMWTCSWGLLLVARLFTCYCYSIFFICQTIVWFHLKWFGNMSHTTALQRRTSNASRTSTTEKWFKKKKQERDSRLSTHFWPYSVKWPSLKKNKQTNDIKASPVCSLSSSGFQSPHQCVGRNKTKDVSTSSCKLKTSVTKSSRVGNNVNSCGENWATGR